MAEGRHRAAVLAVAVGLAVLLAGCGSSPDEGAIAGVRTVDAGGWKGAYLDAPYVVPALALPDTDGKPFSLATDPSPLKVVFYGYTRCPDICQVMMSTISLAVAKLGDERSKVQVVFVTTDPARDTGPVMRRYLDRFAPGYVGLGGDLTSITKLGDPMHVFIAKGKKLPSGGYEVEHSTYVFGVVGNQAKVIWTEGTSPADMAADMIKLLKS